MTKPLQGVVITGVGPVTAIGTGCDAFWDALAAGRTRVCTRTLPADIGRTVDLSVAAMPPASEVPGLDRHRAWLEGQDLGDYRDLAYTLLAIELALADAGLEFDDTANRIGMIQAFEAPGVEATVAKLFGLFSGPPPTDGPPRVYDILAPRFYNMQPFLYVHVVAKAFGLRGFCTNVHNACSTGAFAIEMAAQRITSGQADVMLVVGGESFDTAARLEWFRRLDLYASGDRMRPFDTPATGFYVGEGAGAILLESEAHAKARGAEPYARYLGGAFAHQCWKQTIPDVRAARLAGAITEALERCEVAPEDLDLVIPHGAGTSLSDGYERTCLKRSLEGRAGGALLAPFKPCVGHMLAAGGVVETICGMLAIKHQTVPPQPCDPPDASPDAPPDAARLDIPMAGELTNRRVRTVLKLSTGFTGHDAASIFQKA